MDGDGQWMLVYAGRYNVDILMVLNNNLLEIIYTQNKMQIQEK